MSPLNPVGEVYNPLLDVGKGLILARQAALRAQGNPERCVDCPTLPCPI